MSSNSPPSPLGLCSKGLCLAAPVYMTAVIPKLPFLLLIVIIVFIDHSHYQHQCTWVMTTIIHKALLSLHHRCTHLFKKIGASLILKFDCLSDYYSNLSNVSPVPASLCDSSEVLLYHSTTSSDDLPRLLEIMLQSKSVSIVAVATRPLCPLYHSLVHTLHWIKMKISTTK